MKKLMKADLSHILRLVPVYQPTDPERVEAEIAALCNAAHTDYLFLVRREKCFLFSLPDVFTPDSYANLTWLYGLATPNVPVVALLLHVAKTVDACPWGSVTMLDYPAFAREVDIYTALPEAVRGRHIETILRRNTNKMRYCSMLELIQYLKTGEVKSLWT